MIPTTIVKKFDANAPVNLGPRVGLKVVVRSANIRERKARLKRHQKVRWDRQIGLKKYAASAAIKKLVGSKKNLGSENRTQKTIHRRPQPRYGGLKEKLGVRKSELKNYPSSSTTHKWWTERKIWGPKIGLKNKNNSA